MHQYTAADDTTVRQALEDLMHPSVEHYWGQLSSSAGLLVVHPLDLEAAKLLHELGITFDCGFTARGTAYSRVRLTPEALEHPQVLEALWAHGEGST